MIVTKGMNQIEGHIEYRYDIEDPFHEISEDERDCMYESAGFKSLAEMVEKTSPQALQKIKEEYDASRVWISAIILNGKSEDGETTAQINLTERGSGGHIATKVENKDVESRLLLNLEKVKTIIDNTLENYPIKY